MKKISLFPYVIGSLVLAVLFVSAYAPEAKSMAGEEQQLANKDVTMLPLSGEVRNGSRIINVKAFRYGFAPDPIVVNQGDRVQLDVKSTDVTHGLAIKGYNVNVIVPGGEVKSIVFTAGDQGVFDIECSVFCGPDHGHMHAKFIVK
jgi:cytochrome c oxidase subunit 2